MDIQKLLSDYSQKFNSNLTQFFNCAQGPERRAVESMQYSVMNGGKRLRPFLVAETAALFGIPFVQSFQTAVALEFLHTYSLIHDDLPAMDNDDFRRGKPTCHKQFDEATAILAGDGLLTYAFEILSNEKSNPSAQIRCQLISLLSNAAGAFDGMIAGQMLDLYAEKIVNPDNSEQLVKDIEAMKTGRLIRYACESGAIIGNASAEQTQALVNYARKIGMAFQIADDILDIEGSSELVGKTLQKDATHGKVTFVSLYGLENAKQIAKQLVQEAQDALIIFGTKADNLKLLAQFIIERNH